MEEFARIRPSFLQANWSRVTLMFGKLIKSVKGVETEDEMFGDKLQIASLDDRPGITEKEIAALERKAYEWQVKIYDSHLDILQEDEKVLRLKMNIIKQEIAGLSRTNFFMTDMNTAIPSTK